MTSDLAGYFSLVSLAMQLTKWRLILKKDVWGKCSGHEMLPPNSTCVQRAGPWLLNRENHAAIVASMCPGPIVSVGNIAAMCCLCNTLQNSRLQQTALKHPLF